MPEATTATSVAAGGFSYALGLTSSNELCRIPASALPSGGGGSTYTLPVATASVLGGVKQGTNITIAADGTLSNAYSYTLPAATASVLGGVKQGTNTSIAADGTLSCTYTYALPTASASALGGVKVGNGLSINGSGVLAALATDAVYLSKGTAAAASTQTFDVSAAYWQSITVGGAFTVALSNVPAAGTPWGLKLEVINGGSATITMPSGIKWRKADGSFVTDFATNGVPLQSSGTNFIYIFGRNGTTEIWGIVT